MPRREAVCAHSLTTYCQPDAPEGVLEDAGGVLHHPDQQVVDVVLQVTYVHVLGIQSTLLSVHQLDKLLKPPIFTHLHVAFSGGCNPPPQQEMWAHVSDVTSLNEQ